MHSQDTREIYFPLRIRGLLHSDAFLVHLGGDVTGAPKTNRTSDLPLRRGLLYPLSYRGVRGHFSVKSAPACSLILKENQWLSGC